MKKMLLGMTIFFGLLLISALLMFWNLRNNMKEINALQVTTPDLTTISDGTYVGEAYYKDEIGATVEVTVINNQIQTIVFLEHKCGLGEKAEVIVEDVIREQTLDVDVIAGATSSSTLILLAIEDALGGTE